MNDHLEALLALAKHGTMNSAATHLRLTPSAVSKRIDILEKMLGYQLIQPRGRRVELTPQAICLCERVTPVLAQLRAVIADEKTDLGGAIDIGVSESILVSWGAKLLARASRKVGQVQLKLVTHRSPVIVEKVRSGELTLGVCAGLGAEVDDLRVDMVYREEMVIVPSRLVTYHLKSDPIDVISIESHALSWQSIQRQIKILAKDGIQIRRVQEIQSFGAAVQMAIAGFGHALAPIGIAKALGVPDAKLIRLKKPGIFRPISLVARNSSYARELVQALSLEIKSLAAKL